MKIKQIEELVGIASKNIRFYEEQGLIHPKRADNGYREYSLEDVEILKKIKLLRKIGISIEEIHCIMDEKLSINDALDKRLFVLTQEKDNITSIIQFVDKMANKSCDKTLSFQTFDTEFWLEEMNKTEQEGVDFVNVGKIDIRMKKKLGAVFGGMIIVVFMIFMILLMNWTYRIDPEMPFVACLLLCGVPIIVIIGIIAAIRIRMKEINGGEEDEAAKY